MYLMFIIAYVEIWKLLMLLKGHTCTLQNSTFILCLILDPFRIVFAFDCCYSKFGRSVKIIKSNQKYKICIALRYGRTKELNQLDLCGASKNSVREVPTSDLTKIGSQPSQPYSLSLFLSLTQTHTHLSLSLSLSNTLCSLRLYILQCLCIF